MSLPTHPEQFDCDWLASKLKAPRDSLTGFEATPVGTGQVGDSYRITLHWAGHDTPASQPSSLIAKCPANDAASLETARKLNLYEIEVRWYQQLAVDNSVRAPRPYYAELGDDIGRYILLLEDLSPAIQIQQMAGCDLASLSLALVEAAHLHKARWADARLRQINWLNYGNGRRDFLIALLPSIYPDFCARYQDRLSRDIFDMGQVLIDNYAAYATPRDDLVALTHGDFRLDNMLFTDTEGRAVILDWQTVSAGHPMVDIAYCVSTSLADPTVRAVNEQTLLQDYLDKLGLPDGCYPFEMAWADYRRSAFAGFIMALVSAMLVERTERGDEMFAVMAERSAWQALHLDSLSCI